MSSTLKRRSKREASKNARIKMDFLIDEEFADDDFSPKKSSSRTVKKFTKGSNLSAYKNLPNCISKPMLAVQPMLRIKEPETSLHQNSEINRREAFVKTNLIKNNLFMVKEPLKFRISSNGYEKITKHESEVSTVKRKVAEVSPFVDEQPLDLSMKKNTKANLNPMPLINHERSKSNQLKFSEEFGKEESKTTAEDDFKTKKLFVKKDKPQLDEMFKKEYKIDYLNKCFSCRKNFDSSERQKTTLTQSTDYLENNNKWVVKGKEYSQFAFVSAEEKYQQRVCYPAIERVSSNNICDVTTIKVNDCVLVRANNDEAPYVGKISAIWLDELNYIRLSLIWFYQKNQFTKPLRKKFKSKYDPFNPQQKIKCSKSACKTKFEKKQQLHCNLLKSSRKFELYLSTHSDCVYVSTVEEKCFVFSDYKQWLLKFNRAVANRRCKLNFQKRLNFGLNDKRKETCLFKEEHQYKEHNLFFYCRFYDIENNDIRHLHNNISKLKAKHLAICR